MEKFDVNVIVSRMESEFDHLPAYTNFPWYVRSELHELLRARAVAGQPITDSILVYRRGARMFWAALLDLAKQEDRALLIAESDTVWGCLEDYLDVIVDLFAQAYADQQDAPSTAGDRRARALFDRLCAQDPPVTRGELGATADGLRALIAIAVRSRRRGRVTLPTWRRPCGASPSTASTTRRPRPRCRCTATRCCTG